MGCWRRGHRNSRVFDASGLFLWAGVVGRGIVWCDLVVTSVQVMYTITISRSVSGVELFPWSFNRSSLS